MQFNAKIMNIHEPTSSSRLVGITAINITMMAIIPNLAEQMRRPLQRLEKVTSACAEHDAYLLGESRDVLAKSI